MNKKIFMLYQIQQLIPLAPQDFAVTPKDIDRMMMAEVLNPPQKTEQELLRENIQKEWNW